MRSLPQGKWLALLLAVFLFGPGTAKGTTFLQFDSTFLGNGWFQYRLQLMDDPFFTAVDLSIGINFTNQIDSTGSAIWTNSTAQTNYSDWASSVSYRPRPYEEVFLVRSSEPSYRQGTVGGPASGATLLMGLYLAAKNPLSDIGLVSENMVGYVNIPCLIPCQPGDADGSPTNFSYTLKLVPDVIIQQLIQTNGAVSGVDFVWEAESTFLLEASKNLTTWTNIAYVWSTPSETLWTTNQSLNNLGQFFRLELVAEGHKTNLPPLNTSGLVASFSAVKTQTVAQLVVPRVASCKIDQGSIAVNLITQAKQNYTVNAVDSHKVVRASQSLSATGDSATVHFDPKNLPTPVFFQVTAK